MYILALANGMYLVNVERDKGSCYARHAWRRYSDSSALCFPGTAIKEPFDFSSPSGVNSK